MTDMIVMIALALILGGAAFYVWRAKKNGRKCIGCTEVTCPHRGKDGCGCGGR